MSLDDDDDDFVVPSGSRRSSYVPPSEDGDFVPALPPVSEQETPTSSTGQVPTIGSVGDDSVAQVPVFAESVDVPRIDAEQPGSIVIEVPVAEPADTAESRDQFGLPIVSDPINIPQIVVTDPLPDAVSGTGTDTVFDDNRLFPPAVDASAEGGEVASSVSGETDGSGDSAEFVDSPAEPVETPSLAAVVPQVPVRQSLTPDELSEQLGASGGLSSNDQMALLDAQIPLRERDIAAVSLFLAEVDTLNDDAVSQLLQEAADRFGDLVPELMEFAYPGGEPSEFADDSTPITGISMIEHSETIAVVEDEHGDVVGVSITEVDEITVARPMTSGSAAPAVTDEGQAWALAAPADVVTKEPVKVERHRWTSAAGYVATLVTVVLLAVGFSVFRTGSAPRLELVIAGIAVVAPFVELARRMASRTGLSIRSVSEDTLGKLGGRVVIAVTALISLVVLGIVLLATFAGLDTQIMASELAKPFVDQFGPGVPGSVLAASVLFVGAVIAALPYRVSRALTLVLAGWAAVGTVAVVAMGSALILTSASFTAVPTDPDIASAASASSIALVVTTIALFGILGLSRVRDSHVGVVPLWIGVGLGTVVATGAVVFALLASEGSHFFFALNPVLHIIAPSPAVNVALGASALAPAVIMVSAVLFRFVASTVTRDDRDDAPVAVRWSLLVIPLGIGAIALLGLMSGIIDGLPSLNAVAIPFASLVGILAARGLTPSLWGARIARKALVSLWFVVTVVAFGFTASPGAPYAWFGFINEALLPLGYGLLYIDVFAPAAAMALSFVVAGIILFPSVRRARRDA